MTENDDTSTVRYAGKGVSMKTYWYCPVCLVDVTTYITMTTAPTHSCKKQRGKTLPLTNKGDNK